MSGSSYWAIDWLQPPLEAIGESPALEARMDEDSQPPPLEAIGEPPALEARMDEDSQPFPETLPLEPSQGQAMMASEDTRKPISVLLNEAADLAEDLEKTAAQGAEALMTVASALGMDDDSDEGRTVTEGRTLIEAGAKHLEELRNIAGWCEQISKHLVHVEARLMEHEYLAHEMVRQVQQALKRFVPFPRGDWGYLVRQCLDLSVRSLRSMAKYYLRGRSRCLGRCVGHGDDVGYGNCWGWF